MIIPSVDIADGQTVQLIGGKEQALSAGDPQPWATKYGRVGEIAVIDLDAAMSRGNNADQIRTLLPLARCRVGGGIRDVATAIDWLDAGAAKVILGTAANPEILCQLPRDRVIAALDAVHALPDGDAGVSRGGRIVDQGWKRETGAGVVERITALREHVGGFLITFVEREGRLIGIDMSTIREYVEAAGETRVTIAGGVATADEIAELDRIGVDAQVGMALYKDHLSLAAGFCAPVKSDRPDGLWPTIVSTESGKALGLAWSNLESIDQSLETGFAHYWSRKRGLWKKGETSGAVQQLISVDVDCDRDALQFRVQQTGRGFCHLPQSTCFGELTGVEQLQRRLISRVTSAPANSYTRRLFESPELLHAKVMEEAEELTTAETREEIVHEAADLVFFTLTKLVSENIGWTEVENELERRASLVSRRDSPYSGQREVADG